MNNPKTDDDQPRILVFGYQEVGYNCLDELLSQRANVIGLFTHDDDQSENIWFRSTADLARRNGIPVYNPKNVGSSESIEHIRSLRPDLIFSFYYRDLLPTTILEAARLGAYNMHGSLLPKFRGRAPVNWVLVCGETETGVTLHEMSARADAGGIVDQEVVPIGATDTAQDLYLQMAQAARTVLRRSLPRLISGRATIVAQDESRASYYGRRRPEDGEIDWQKSNAVQIFNLIRAVTHPYPGAFTGLRGRRLYIWWARPLDGVVGRPGEVVSESPLYIAARDGAIEILRYQWEAEPEHDASACDCGLRCGQILGR